MNQALSFDTTNIKNWIFDLDDTLYPPTKVLNDEMSSRICAYVMKVLNLNETDAKVVQKGYYKKYGATVRGLTIEHNIVPEDFTEYVHQLDLSVLKKNEELIECLKNISGKRFIFTNGADFHAKRVLKQIGMTDLFTGIFSIKDANYIPKPAPETYQKMLDTFGIKASESIMFDDSQSNILGAKKAGLKSVWISSNIDNNQYCNVEEQDFCDYQVPSLLDFFKS